MEAASCPQQVDGDVCFLEKFFLEFKASTDMNIDLLHKVAKSEIESFMS